VVGRRGGSIPATARVAVYGQSVNGYDETKKRRGGGRLSPLPRQREGDPVSISRVGLEDVLAESDYPRDAADPYLRLTRPESQDIRLGTIRFPTL